MLSEDVGHIKIAEAVTVMYPVVRKHGMRKVLLGLIGIVEGGDEDYVKRLHADLKSALDNYDKRYGDGNGGQEPEGQVRQVPEANP